MEYPKFVSGKTLRKFTMIFQAENLKSTLFLDIETAPEYKYYSELPDIYKKLWKRKAFSLDKTITKDDEEAISKTYENKAGIYSEFSKIICISVGFIDTNGMLRIKSFCDESEQDLLENFSNLLATHYPTSQGYFLCGHNIKEFDAPFLCRRMLINGIEFPELLQISGKKPWQTEHLLDTMDMWRFGDIKSYTSLELLATVLGIATPKEDIDGSQVGNVYWHENDLERIVQYCQRDVVTVVQIMQKYASLPLINAEDIEFVN